LLNIGQIDFINMLPLIWEERPPFPLTIKKGPPTAVNRMLLEGEIDGAVISLSCFLDNRDALIRLGNLGILSRGEVMSVMLFSRINLAQRPGSGRLKLSATSQSATSIELNRIILKKVYGTEIIPVSSVEEAEAVLLIGNEALLERRNPRWSYRYDLGREWRHLTGLPAVFAVLATSRTSWVHKQNELTLFLDFLNKTYQQNKTEKDALVARAKRIIDLEVKTLYRYFECLVYEIGAAEEEAINLFDRFRRDCQD
jgi:chorismate dehydratase